MPPLWKPSRDPLLPTFVGEEIPNFLFLLGTIILVWTKRYWVHAVIVSLMLGYTVWDYLPHGLA